MLRPTVHLPNQSAAVNSLQICLKTSSPSAAGVQWAWEPLLKAVDFSGWLEPKSLGCKTSCPSRPFTVDCLCSSTRARARVGARVLTGARLLHKVQTLGPPATCLLPKGRVVTCKQRPGGQERRGHVVIVSCPPLSFLRSHSGETSVRQSCPPAGRERVLPHVSINRSSELASCRAWGQEVPNSLVNIIELALQYPREGRGTEGLSQPSHLMDKKLRLREGNRGEVFGFGFLYEKTQAQRDVGRLTLIQIVLSRQRGF